MQEQNKTNNNKIHTNTCFADWINDLNPALHKYCYPFADVCERSFQLNSFHYVFFPYSREQDIKLLQYTQQ